MFTIKKEMFEVQLCFISNIFIEQCDVVEKDTRLALYKISTGTVSIIGKGYIFPSIFGI